jgi:diguanylate cyclase (GGDEF)-like protein
MNREIALLDPVTGIYNRRYARIMLQREVNRANRYGSVLAIMMVDVTGFRRVNESLGHTGGDVILRQIALLLQNKIRNSDIIIRFGGDEFLLVLPEAQEEGIEKLAERIRESIHEWAPTAGVAELNLNFAIGIAYYKSNSQIDKVILLAEQRMLEDRLAPQPQRK